MPRLLCLSSQILFCHLRLLILGTLCECLSATATWSPARADCLQLMSAHFPNTGQSLTLLQGSANNLDSPWGSKASIPFLSSLLDLSAVMALTLPGSFFVATVTHWTRVGVAGIGK